MPESYTVFDSPIGSIGLVWTERGISALLLPERTAARTEQVLRARYRAASASPPPPPIRRAIRGILALLAGRAAPLHELGLDLSNVSPFYRAVYEAARRVGPGETESYGGLARALGKPGAARAVGQALGRNPIAIIIPCHRILAQGGALGGFTAPGGAKTKARLLAIERAKSKTSPELPAQTQALLAVRASRGGTRELSESALALARIEPKFKAVMERAGPMRIERGRGTSVFFALAKAITHQQLSGKAAASIWSRVSTLHEGGLTPAFAQSAPLSVLRAAGLSEAKALSIRDLAEKVVAGTIPERRSLLRMSDEEIIERITTVRGVGRWTVEMFLIFDLGRPDVLSTGDYGVRKGYSLVFGTSELPTPKELAAYGARWAPHRTAATWYLWRALEHAP